MVYDGFGNITSESNASFGDRYKWTGREWDAEAELQYNRARFYDRAIGRWISRDPLGFSSTDVNLYRYVRNSSTTQVDSSGFIGVTMGDGVTVEFGTGDPQIIPSISLKWEAHLGLFRSGGFWSLGSYTTLGAFLEPPRILAVLTN
ncbi:MAG: RHS repeat-associated core domain-containing protein [Gemmataceae bacterium]